MNNNSATIEERLQNMKNFYLSVERIIDSLPDSIPSDVKKMLQKHIVGDTELRKLMDGVDKHRPPRIFLIGRTGTGKSKFVNGLIPGSGSLLSSGIAASGTDLIGRAAIAHYIEGKSLEDVKNIITG